MDVQEIFWLFVNPLQAIRGVRDFLELGGDVLLLITVSYTHLTLPTKRIV